jgi:hypothetical protein
LQFSPRYAINATIITTMRLPIATLTAAVAALPVAVTALTKEERKRYASKNQHIFTKDGLKGKQAETVNQLLKQYHVTYEDRQKEKRAAASEGEESSTINEAKLDDGNASSRRTIHAPSPAAGKESGGVDAVVDAAAAATTTKSNEEITKDLRRQARRGQRDRKNERRAAAQKNGEGENAAPDAAAAATPSANNKERRAATAAKYQPEARKSNPRPPPSEVPERGGKPRPSGGARRDLQKDPSVLTTADLDKRELKKSKKGSYSGSGSWSGNSYSGEDTCIVHMTNLTPRQQWSDIFVMTHSDKMYPPLFEYGDPAFDDLAALAQDGDTDELLWYYDSDWGDDFVYWVDSVRGPIGPGESISFGIDASGSYDRLTLATSFIFSNDGFVAINGEDIYDGAVYWLWGIDAGVEANTQLCWTVQARDRDFPPQSACYDDRFSNDNDNSIPGVGYVHVHSGIHDLDGKGDVKDLLSFTCDDLDANNFADYFATIGFDDDLLLRLDDDREFIDYLRLNDDLQRYPIVDLALLARNFDTFCE